MNNWSSRFIMWYSKAMAGRHGGDQLSIALLVLYCILLMFSSIFHTLLLFLLALAALVFCILRMLSRNNGQRWKENTWFMSWWGPVWNRMRGISAHFHSEQEFAAMKARDRDVSRYFKCPKCKNKLRVPKGKGKIVITCPVCHTSFTKHT